MPGGRAWYRLAASDRAIPLLMLQGGPGTSPGYFEPLVTVSEDRTVALYDALDDAAVAAGPSANEWGYAYRIDRLREVRAVLGLERVHIFGYGWGAVAALDYALSQPEGLASLIFDPVDPAAFIHYICQAAQVKATQASYLCPRVAARLAHLDKIRVPALLIWEETAGGVGDVTPCEDSLRPGWELAVLRKLAALLDDEEADQFTRAVRRFLARVESESVGVKAFPTH